MKKLFRAILKWFKDSGFADWLTKVFKYQLGKITSIIYKDAVSAVKETKEMCEWIIETGDTFAVIQEKVQNSYGIYLDYKKIADIKNFKMRTRFEIAKELLINELKDSKVEYKEYIVDTVIQLAYSFLKERSE